MTTVPKAYRPIALLNTLGKVMDIIIAKQISYITKTYQHYSRTSPLDSIFGQITVESKYDL